jgi:DNA invertase Pin-like site-specific DNA recombinase
MAEGHFVSYFRVSTQAQELQQQKDAVARYLNGGSWKVVAEFEEKETGKKASLSNRPALRAAIAKAKETSAVLLIAKIDRLARNVHFISGLMEAKVKFIAVDLPEANDLTIHIMAAMAEQEAKLISTRTKDRLAVLKATGVRLGNPNNGTEEQTLKANAGARRKADAYAETVIGEIRKWQAKGITTYKDLADMLSGKIKTPRGEDRWQATQVKRIIERAQARA